MITITVLKIMNVISRATANQVDDVLFSNISLKSSYVYNEKGRKAALANRDRDLESVLEILGMVCRDGNEIIVKVKVISEGDEKGKEYYTSLSNLQNYSKPTTSPNSKQP